MKAFNGESISYLVNKQHTAINNETERSLQFILPEKNITNYNSQNKKS